MYDHEEEDTGHVVELLLQRMNGVFCPGLPANQFTLPPKPPKKPVAGPKPLAAAAAAVAPAPARAAQAVPPK